MGWLGEASYSPSQAHVPLGYRSLTKPNILLSKPNQATHPAKRFYSPSKIARLGEDCYSPSNARIPLGEQVTHQAKVLYSPSQSMSLTKPSYSTHQAEWVGWVRNITHQARNQFHLVSTSLTKPKYSTHQAKACYSPSQVILLTNPNGLAGGGM